MDELFRAIDDWFLTDQGRLQVVQILTCRGRQREGWFTGEMMACLEGMREDPQHPLEQWYPEVRLPETGRKVDFALRWEPGGLVLIEVKDLLIGTQRRRTLAGQDVQEDHPSNWRLTSYVGGETSGWIVTAATRLHELGNEALKFVLIFAHAAVCQQDVNALAECVNAALDDGAVEIAHFQRSRGPELSIIWFEVAG